jgi:hypothetical protein
MKARNETRSPALILRHLNFLRLESARSSRSLLADGDGGRTDGGWR